MPRSKNYQASAARAKQVAPSRAGPDCAEAAPDVESAYIDMVVLLGPDTRFGKSSRTLDLRAWLGHGIDAWVWAAASCLKALLLSGVRQTSTVTAYRDGLEHFFAYLTEERVTPRVAAPVDLSPLHVHAFVGWIQKRGQDRGWTVGSTRQAFNSVKAVLLEMFARGMIPGEARRYFARASLPSRDRESRQSSLSDGEQERLALAIKSDLVAIHHERLTLNPGDVQALRLLLVGHRQGINLTPLLELRRDAMAPGLIPGTVRLRTGKFRNRKVRSSAARSATTTATSDSNPETDIVFSLAEGAVLQQAIASTQGLIDDAPSGIKNRVWLYRAQHASHGIEKGSVICLTGPTLRLAINALIKRHHLLGDDGRPLRLNLSRLRKSYFDRALRIADDNLAITANLMGNTPQVAGANYPSMNQTRVAEAAAFLNSDYAALTRGGTKSNGEARTGSLVIEFKDFKTTPGTTSAAQTENTPISGCMDSLNGQHAPKDGHNHCDRYVMCLFCYSFAILGTVDDLWRLYSFQSFARQELRYLDTTLRPEHPDNDALADLRDRYRLAIPFIDDFTRRQFPAGNVAKARARTEAGLHPFWAHQIKMSRRARIQLPGGLPNDGEP